MNPGDAGIRVAVGVSGSGKTHAVRHDVYTAASAHGMPIVVLDRMREWSRGDAHARTMTEARRHFEAGARLVLLRCEDVAAATVEACAWARDWPGRAGVAIPEAHRACPVHARLAPPVEDVVCAWRHYDVALWLDTQRFALMSRTVTEQARLVRLFATTGALDLRGISDLGGRELVQAVRLCGERLARGEQGWHVPLGVSRLPPYVPVRL